MDLRQTKHWGEYLKALGWDSLETKGNNLRIKKLGVLGSIIKIQRPRELNEKILQQIATIAQKERAIIVKLEPNLGFNDERLLAKYGYKKDTWPTVPAHTIILDLSDNIPNTYTKDARYSIRKAEKAGILTKFFKTTNPQAQKEFYKLYKESAKGKFFVSSFEKDFIPKCQALDKSSFIALASCDNKNKGLSQIWDNPYSGAFVCVVGDTAHYLHAGTTQEGKDTGAPYKLILEICQKLKKDKVKYLDLEGIYDPRYPKFTKGWQGFTHFKSQFGGRIMEFPPSYTKYRGLLKLLASFSY
ncbi:peptidoglycan bridge formation glycyltransferase FemA/FemB family protein [Candidatus Parcubacteria bacterium]|nr:peptidoglycan bridge formation glycyltransferase FemA/FemB family protein [Patescibacteria group bacterium]MCG2689572.1 peptidoglycan bridge formation glycyltransferase FemA/FemB family protein [Candidatus Parcubacteria bacterium]